MLMRDLHGDDLEEDGCVCSLHVRGHFDGLDGLVEATRLARCAIPQRDEA
jgi:hypothetical protein